MIRTNCIRLRFDGCSSRVTPAPTVSSCGDRHGVDVLLDALQFLSSVLHSHQRLAAENLFLRKQLALYIERQAKPRRATNATRECTLASLSTGGRC